MLTIVDVNFHLINVKPKKYKIPQANENKMNNLPLMNTSSLKRDNMILYFKVELISDIAFYLNCIKKIKWKWNYLDNFQKFFVANITR